MECGGSDFLFLGQKRLANEPGGAESASIEPRRRCPACGANGD
jgi:hypothetical protein